MLTFEFDPDGILEVTCDEAGRVQLVSVLQRLVVGDHEHLSTPDWGGDTLTDTFPNPDLVPIHQVTFQVLSSEEVPRGDVGDI
jgi:hypothetical protein